jgi:cysteine synthase A
MKSKLGENSRFVELDIDTEEKLVEAFTKMDTALRAEAKKKAASDTIFNRYPGIIVEKMLEKAPNTVEASVEMVVQDGKLRFAMVSDTHGIGKKGELAGGSMTFPSQMTQQVQDALIAASVKALEVIGLKDGNARIDIMMTPDGPRVIEINPFLGGAAIYTAVKLVSGISLVEWGIRAMLGLKLPQMPSWATIVDYRFAASQATGEIISVSGVDDAKKVPGVKHVQLLAGPGDTVAAPIENGFEEWAEVMGTGASFEEARKASVEALSKIKARVVSEQSADYLQPKGDEKK